ncbi:hypothetical protein JYQ62_04935 [Nostoc sp. UHCC 0702]|nr:hypothetical protein JYQ62_04935 [Nostoc sp. UHCC 0702]
MDRKQTILEKLDSLTLEQQDDVLNFIEFLQFKVQKQEFKEEEKEAISFYEATKEIAGSLDWGPGDLATNKTYLEQMGKE